MLKLIAIVRPQRAPALCQRLVESGLVEELEAMEVVGCNRQIEEVLRASYPVEAVPEVRIEGLVEQEHVPALLEAVFTTCRTGRQGDGKVFLIRIEGYAV